MATIFVDDKKIEAKDGELLIDVLTQNNIIIPHFCYHKALGKDGNCRMCMVEIEGQKRPQIACDTPVKDAMIVRTKSEKISKVKKSILELELINHPLDCPICDQAGECKLQDYYMDVGLYESRVQTPKNKAKKHISLGQNVMLDQERCVLCTRCVRFTTQITKTGELGVIKRADHSVIGTFAGKKLQNPYSMNVVDLCPVGALTNEDFRFKKRVWFLKSDEIICDGCAKGCNIYCDYSAEKYHDDVIYRYRPRFNEKVNGHFICDFGRLSYKKENENRLIENLILNEKVEQNKAVSQSLKKLCELKNACIVLGMNLSLEEFLAFKELSAKFSAKLLVSSYFDKDENFGDDFLRKSDLSLNRNGAKLLKLDISEENPHDLIAKHDNLIFVNLKNQQIYIDEANKLNKTFALISTHESENIQKALFVLKSASHSERVGTFINCDNIIQKSIGRVKSEIKAPELTLIVASFLNLEHYKARLHWESELKNTLITQGYLHD